MESKNMFISSINAESLLNILKNSKHQYPLTADIKTAVSAVTHASMNEVYTSIPHPVSFIFIYLTKKLKHQILAGHDFARIRIPFN